MDIPRLIEGNVALGSDFDGGVVVPFDTTGEINITEALVQGGCLRKKLKQ